MEYTIQHHSAYAMQDKFAVIERSVSKIANLFNISKSQLKSRTRKRIVVELRQIVVYDLMIIQMVNVETIAEYFGMDRTTMIHCRDTVSNRISVEPDYRHKVERMTA